MSNGQPDQNKGLIPFMRPDVVVSPDEYAANLNKIAKIRQLAATMEQTNQQAHQRYIQQELQRRVEEGERAQQMLANMSASNNQTIIPPNPVTFFAPAASQVGHQDQQNVPHIIPTTARIEEIPSSASSRTSQQVDGRSTIRVPSAGLNDQSQQPTARQSYGGQTHSTVNQSNTPRFGGTMQGRWQAIQPRQQQQQQPQSQRQPQPLSQQQISRQQQQLLLQHQRQQQQQQRYAHPQITQYGISAPGQFSQPQILGHTHPGHGSNHPQSVTIPAANTSSLEGALGVPGSRATSSSSHRATPAPTGQPDPPVNQSGTQEQHADTQRRQSMDKDVIAANVIQRMGPNYISDMVAEAQANPSTTLPKPPTRENRAAAAAASQAPASTTTSEPQKAEALINLEPPVPVSPSQVRSNTRHVATQRPNNVPVDPVSTSAASTLPLSTPTSSNTHQAASAHQPITPNGLIPSNVSTAPPSAYTRPSISSISQNVAPVQPHVQRGRQWLSYVPPGQPALQSGFQPGSTRPWITPKIAPAISHSVMNPAAQRTAAVIPTTPTNQQTQQSQMGVSPRTPASADKKHLARDILRSLGGSHLLSGKRKRSEEPSTAAKRLRPSQDVQTNADALASDSASNIQSDSAISNQQISVDSLPIHASALQREEEEEGEEEGENKEGKEEEEEEIMLVEDMMSLSPLPGPQLAQTAVKSSSPPLHSDEIIDISDDELQNEKSPAKPIEALPITASVSSPFPSAQSIPSKAKEPLFLPSPSSSPRSAQSLHDPDKDPLNSGGDNIEVEAPWDMPSVDLGDVTMEQLRSPEPKKRQKKMKVYVLIPPPPDWVKRAKQIGKNFPSRRGKNQRQTSNNARRIPWLPDDEDVGDSENGIEEIEGSEGRTSQATSEVDTREAKAEKRRQAEAAEREAMSLTSSVLRKQPCKWRYCDVVMNTVDKLSQHVIQHVKNKPEPYICLWKNCGRRFSEESKLLAHIDSHVRSPVPCPYQDCDLAYRTPKDLVAHCRIEHSDDQRRTSPKPFKPTLTSLPPVPTRLPSYMVVPRDIRQTPISKDRHALLGPWVLRNIFGPVNLEGKRQNAAVPLRSARGVMDKEDSSSQFIASDEYDFLRPKSPSSTPKIRLDDIPSAAVSGLVHAGLVFWGPNTNTRESDLMDIDQALDKIDHGDEEDKDQPEALAENIGLLSVSDGETEDRHDAIETEGGTGPHSNIETQAKASETACVVF